MPTGKYVTLPGSKTAPADPAPFPVGSTVCLRNCPGPHGVVRGMKRKRVIVYWPDLDCLGNHFPGTLVLAAEPDDTDEEKEEENDDAE